MHTENKLSGHNSYVNTIKGKLKYFVGYRDSFYKDETIEFGPFFEKPVAYAILGLATYAHRDKTNIIYSVYNELEALKANAVDTANRLNDAY